MNKQIDKMRESFLKLGLDYVYCFEDKKPKIPSNEKLKEMGYDTPKRHDPGFKFGEFQEKIKYTSDVMGLILKDNGAKIGDKYLLCLDLDCKESKEAEKIDLRNEVLTFLGTKRSYPGIEITQSGGAHIFYLVNDDTFKKLGNLTKINISKKPKIEIELFTKNKYIVLAPSKGYTALNGDMVDLENLQEISFEMLERLESYFIPSKNVTDEPIKPVSGFIDYNTIPELKKFSEGVWDDLGGYSYVATEIFRFFIAIGEERTFLKIISDYHSEYLKTWENFPARFLERTQGNRYPKKGADHYKWLKQLGYLKRKEYDPEEGEEFDLKKSIDNYRRLRPTQRYKEAKRILNHYNGIYKKINGLLYCKRENFYSKMHPTDFIEYMGVSEEVSIPKSLGEEVLKIINWGVESQDFPEEKESLISFDDCLVNIYTGEKVEDNGEFVYWRANCNFQDLLNDRNNAWKNHLDKMLGQEQTKTLLSFLYLSMLNKHNRYSLIYYSEGRDGKGTCMTTFKEMFRKSKNIDFFKPEVFLKEFNTYNLYMKEVAVIDETEKIPVSTAKQITGGKSVQAEKKGTQAIEIDHNVSLIFLTNNIISMRTFDKAEKNRFILLKHIAKSEPSDEAAKLLEDNGIELLKLILTVGRDHYLKTKGNILYHHPEMLEDYEETNNPIEYHLKKYFEMGDLENNYMSMPQLDMYFMGTELSREWNELNNTAKGLTISKIVGRERITKRVKGVPVKVFPLKKKPY